MRSRGQPPFGFCSASFASQAGIATVQIAAACVTSGILLPIYIAFLVKRLEKKKAIQEAKLATSEITVVNQSLTKSYLNNFL